MTTLKQWNPTSSQWETIVVGGPGAGVVPGGTTGQVLTKTSGTDFATSWQTPATGGVSTARTISTTAPLTGGGDLSADRTLAISDFTTTSRGAVPNPTATSGRFLKDDGTWALTPGGASGAGNVFPFTYNTSTVEPPTGNQLRGNNATFASSTKLWVMETTTDGLDVSVGLGRVKAGFQIYVQDYTSAARYALFSVVADAIDKGAYWEIGVSPLAAAGTIPGGKVALQSLSSAQSSTLFSTTTTAPGLTPGSNGVGTTMFLRADGTWAAPPAGGGGGDMLAANNLSELTNKATARTNLGVAIGSQVQAFDADLTTIAGLTATTNNFMVAQASAWASVAPATAKTTLALTAGDVGLGNVSNTSDATKDAAATTLTNKTLTDPKITQTINAQTGTTYTLVLTDNCKLLTHSNAAAITVTVPPNSSVAFPVGCHIDLAQIGAGKVTVAAGGGVTVNATPSLGFRAQYSGASLYKLATDQWILIGDLA